MGNLDTANIRINRKDYPRILGLLPRSAAALGYDGNDHILIHNCPYALAKRFILRIGFEVECGTEWRKIRIADVKMLNDAFEYITPPSKYPYTRSMITSINYIDEDTNVEFYHDRIEVTHVIDSEEKELSVKFNVISGTEFAIKLKENNFDYKYLRFESNYNTDKDEEWIRIANVYCKKISQEVIIPVVDEQNNINKEYVENPVPVESKEDDTIKEDSQEEKIEKSQNSYHRNNNQKYDKNKKYERR